MPTELSVDSTSGFGLDPDFAATVATLLADCRAKGYDFRISQGLRTPHKQAEYYCKWDGHPPADVDTKVKKLKDAGAPWLASVLADYRDIARSNRWVTGAMPGEGWHQWGLAADCYCFRNGQMVEDGDDPCYKYYAERATQLGLRAGLYFSHPDAGHVQGPSAGKAADVYSWTFIDKTMKERFGEHEAVAVSPTSGASDPSTGTALHPMAGPGLEAASPSGFFKDDPALIAAAVKPASLYQLPSSDATLRAMARTYNAVGGLIDTMSAKLSIDPVAMLAVWYVESGGREFVPGEPILRFEAHKFWKYWGEDHAAQFDAHFQFGGHNGVSGGKSKNHAFRANAGDPWRKIHVDSQEREYEAFDLAKQLGGEEAACMSSSFGGPQIVGFNHDVIGYPTALAMAQAFRADERWHVLGFADFCKTNSLIDEIRDRRWVPFGAGYNGDGPTYGPLIKRAFDKKAALLALPKQP